MLAIQRIRDILQPLVNFCKKLFQKKQSEKKIIKAEKEKKTEGKIKHRSFTLYMTRHIKIYMEYYDLGMQDIITCEVCLLSGRIDGSGFDIHHIQGRGNGKDVIENIMCLCRNCHTLAHKSVYSKTKLTKIHKKFL